MFTLKLRAEIAARGALIAVMLFNAFAPTAASASIQEEKETTPSGTNAASDIASHITLGTPQSKAYEQVPILSEQIAKQAQE